MTAIPKISAAVMRERMVERARRERIPLQADIEIIATCNFKCVHCYIAPCAEDGPLIQRPARAGGRRRAPNRWPRSNPGSRP